MIDEHGTLLPLMSDATKQVMTALLDDAVCNGEARRIMDRIGVAQQQRYQTERELEAIAEAFDRLWTREDRARGSRSWT